jgi:hypothetical protein
MRKAIKLLTLMLVVMLGLLGLRYNQWVSYSATPFDEVGVGLHRYMPAPVKSWGCTRLKARFGGKTLPPYGCHHPANPRMWR